MNLLADIQKAIFQSLYVNFFFWFFFYHYDDNKPKTSVMVSISKFLHLSNFYIVLDKFKRMFIRLPWENTFLLHYKEKGHKQLIKGSFILWDMWVIELWQNSWFDFQLEQWNFIKPVEMENQSGPIPGVSCIT